MVNSSDHESTLNMHAIVNGDVQGVGFRVLTLKYARQLGLGGDVRNLSDGNVEINAQGSRNDLDKLLDLLKQNLGSNIADISTSFVPYNDVLKEFQILN